MNRETELLGKVKLYVYDTKKKFYPFNNGSKIVAYFLS